MPNLKNLKSKSNKQKKDNAIVVVIDSCPCPRSGVQEGVAKLAYQFYSDRGCQHGHDQEDWFRAEAIIKQQQ